MHYLVGIALHLGLMGTLLLAVTSSSLPLLLALWYGWVLGLDPSCADPGPYQIYVFQELATIAPKYTFLFLRSQVWVPLIFLSFCVHTLQLWGTNFSSFAGLNLDLDCTYGPQTQGNNFPLGEMHVKYSVHVQLPGGENNISQGYFRSEKQQWRRLECLPYIMTLNQIHF